MLGRLRRSLRRIKFLASAEVLHVVRDRATMAQIIVMPVVQLLVLTYAATFQIRGTPAYIVDLDRTSTSRGVVTRLAASGRFTIVGASPSPALGTDALLRGTATMVVTIPDRFEEDLVRAGSAPIHLDLNGEKGAAAGIVQGYAAQILADYSSELGETLRPNVRNVSPPASTPPIVGAPRIDIRLRGWYNATLDYTHYMVPGILVALVTMIGTLLTAQNVAREKEVGTLEQLNVTPITRGEFIAAKLLPYWGLALADLAIGLAVGKWAFGIPMRGSLLLLFGCAAIYLVVALGIGLWVSTIVATQQQAMFVSFFIIMIYLLMSGLFTPIDSMPHWVQLLSALNPVRYFVTIARAVLVKGAGIREIAAPVLTLVVYGAVVLTLAVRQYRKQTA